MFSSKRFIFAILLCFISTAVSHSVALKYPREIEVGNGKKIVLTKPPQRIVSFTLATDEILSELVAPSRIQAVTYLVDDPTVSNVTEWAKQIPFHIHVDMEQIVSREPDIIFVASYTQAEILEQLQSAQLPYVLFEAFGSIEEVEKNIMRVAEVVGEIDKGKELARRMKEKVALIDAKVKNSQSRPKVMSYAPSGYTSGSHSTVHELILRGGGRNVSAENGIEVGKKVSFEKVIEWNPDILILSGYMPGDEGFDQMLRSNPALQNVNAVKNKKVIVVDGKYLTCVSQYIADSLNAVTHAIHPELFKK